MATKDVPDQPGTVRLSARPEDNEGIDFKAERRKVLLPPGRHFIVKAIDKDDDPVVVEGDQDKTANRLRHHGYEVECIHTVHVLYMGFAGCKFTTKVPAEWPAGHSFLAIHAPDLDENITCEGCKRELVKIRAPKVVKR